MLAEPPEANEWSSTYPAVLRCVAVRRLAKMASALGKMQAQSMLNLLIALHAGFQCDHCHAEVCVRSLDGYEETLTSKMGQ